MSNTSHQDERGHKSIRRSAHVKYIAPSEKVVKQLPAGVEKLWKKFEVITSREGHTRPSF